MRSPRLTPGGAGAVQTTAVTDNLTQSDTGTCTVDANWATSAADRVNVSGSATFDGTVVVIPQNFPTTAGLTNQFLILSATNGATDVGITAQDTATVDYDVVFDPNGRDVYLTALINFLGVGTGGLNPNQTGIAENINAIITAGGAPGFSPVADALMTLPTQAALANALDQLSAEIYGYEKIDALFAAEQFSSDLMSCRVANGDGAAVIREGQCIWARAARASSSSTALPTTSAPTARSESFSRWRSARRCAGLAASRLRPATTTASLSTGTGASSDGDRANVGAALKSQPGVRCCCRRRQRAAGARMIRRAPWRSAGSLARPPATAARTTCPGTCTHPTYSSRAAGM